MILKLSTGVTGVGGVGGVGGTGGFGGSRFGGVGGGTGVGPGGYPTAAKAAKYGIYRNSNMIKT